ncbi:MAG: DNA repair protein RecO [Candidatus Kapabacteria bacterium]|nr:DNA repair protein RecO [Candidatus Kapabacteria bacterium]MDW8012472.1 DNA repair protein RecO [Bacteroidota bacterium]
MVAESAAIALRTQRHGDTSLVATVYTQQFGKCSVLAKGARSVGSPHRAAFEVPNHIWLVFYRTPRRELYYVRSADVVEHFPRLRSSLDHTAVALSIAESVYLTQRPEEPNPVLFSLLLQALRSVDRSPTPPFSVAVAFMLRLLHLLGFAPSLQVATLREPTTQYSLSLEDGRFVPYSSPQHTTFTGTMLTLEDVQTLQSLRELPLEVASSISLPAERAANLLRSFVAYLEHHLEHPLPLQSLVLWNVPSPPLATR